MEDIHLIPASINFVATGDNTVIAAVTSRYFEIYALFLIVSAATNIQFKDGASTNLTGVMNLAANNQVKLDPFGLAWFTGSINTAFIINQSGTAQISGRIYYIAKQPVITP